MLQNMSALSLYLIKYLITVDSNLRLFYRIYIIFINILIQN